MNIQQSHIITGGKETYILKFKDKPNRSGFVIKNDEYKTIKLQEIHIIKVPRENNKIIVELIHSIRKD